MSLSLESTKLEHTSGPALPCSSDLNTGPALGKPPAQGPQAWVESPRKGEKETHMGTGREKRQSDSQGADKESRREQVRQNG